MRQAVSVDIDGTIALSLASLCAAVNAKCGTQYTMFDLSDAIGWHHVFEDNPDADEWAQTFMSYKHGDQMATIGFYKAMAGDLGGIAAVNMLHKAGVHVTIATLRDPHMYSLTKWWLDHWGVQYDELLCAPNSKFVLAAKGPTVFVDDRLEVERSSLLKARLSFYSHGHLNQQCRRTCASLIRGHPFSTTSASRSTLRRYRNSQRHSSLRL